MARTKSGPMVVHLCGEHDISTVAGLSKTLARAISRNDADLVIDLRAVTFLDAATVGALLRARRMLVHRSRCLTLRSPSRMARRVLELSGLGPFIEPEPGGTALRSWVAVPTTTTRPAQRRVVDREGR